MELACNCRQISYLQILCIGVVLAVLSLSGNVPCLREELKIFTKKGATTSFAFFKSLTGILLCPVDLDVFNFASTKFVDLSTLY